ILFSDKPADGKFGGTYMVTDMSAGDLDGDGEYELIVRWDPSNAKDNSQSGDTDNVYLDAYKMNGQKLWRMDLGPNIRAGTHYTQFIVYDFDGDGKAEVAYKTATGSKDGKGNYVSLAGKNITPDDDTAEYRNEGGHILDGSEWLTIFNGETGEAMQTVDYNPPRTVKEFINQSLENYPPNGWGDDYGGVSERYLAGVAYLDGKTPSLIMVRGYYSYDYVAAYKWNGTDLELEWLSSNSPVLANINAGYTSDDIGCIVTDKDGNVLSHQEDKTLFGQGAHSLSVADVDNDGKDEIVFGSAVLDNDGSVLIYDGRGHGDAEHVNDFDNDGKQEIFMVHEAGKGNDNLVDYAADIKRYDAESATGGYDVMKQVAKGDIGRGVIANIDDDYAMSSGNLFAFWSVAADGLYNMNGDKIGNIPNSNDNLFWNFFIWWDGDLGREMLDKNMIAKQDIDTNTTYRFYFNNQPGISEVTPNPLSKLSAGLVADLFGDWREEAVYALGDGTGIRIFFSTIPTEYRLTTLMHDSQYRCAIAWQNVAYNQPPHTSYYIGSAALAKDESGKALKYLSPATPYTSVIYNANDTAPVKPNAYSVQYQEDGSAIAAAPRKGTHSVIFAAYKNGVLTSIKTTDAVFEAAEEITVPKPDGFVTDVADTVKVMLWSSLKEMKPLCEADIK
ncbi:MAG: hypothetical protein ACI4A5_11530, partial [Hominilimicola sp.]